MVEIWEMSIDRDKLYVTVFYPEVDENWVLRNWNTVHIFDKYNLPDLKPILKKHYEEKES